MKEIKEYIERTANQMFEIISVDDSSYRLEDAKACVIEELIDELKDELRNIP